MVPGSREHDDAKDTPDNADEHEEEIECHKASAAKLWWELLLRFEPASHLRSVPCNYRLLYTE
jgi:hypothetical protein